MFDQEMVESRPQGIVTALGHTPCGEHSMHWHAQLSLGKAYFLMLHERCASYKFASRNCLSLGNTSTYFDVFAWTCVGILYVYAVYGAM